jgi:site-specific DNA-cytosine methylase
MDTLTGKRMQVVKPGECEGKHFNRIRLHPNRPAPTLCHDFMSWFHAWHWDSPSRPLRTAEWKVLGGFPSWFLFDYDEKIACPLIGNSVTPPVARAIGEHIANLLHGKVVSG